MSKPKGKILKVIVPGLPHILQPNLNQSYAELNKACVDVGLELKAKGVERIVYYSTQWLSVLGQSVQTRKSLSGSHVDENWYEFPKLDYSMNVDDVFAANLIQSTRDKGFQVRPIDYEGFPIDTGTIVANGLLNRFNAVVGMFSCCVYSDYQETKALGGILADAIAKSDKLTAVVCVSGLSSRYFTTEIDYREDHVRTKEDDQSNKKLLDLFSKGRWDEVAAFRDQYCKETKADMGLKALGWLEGVGLTDEVLKTRAYGSIYGTGAAVLTSW